MIGFVCISHACKNWPFPRDIGVHDIIVEGGLHFLISSLLIIVCSLYMKMSMKSF